MKNFLITLFGGAFGVHKFLAGKCGLGFLYLFTGGLFGIGWLIDTILAAKKLSESSIHHPAIHNTSSNFPQSHIALDELRKIPSKQQRYDMDSLDGINSIPVPAKDYDSGEWTKDCIYYVLQRKATEHKKNNKMDLAIACLRKSNALSDYEEKPLLLEKDYLRLPKYIRLTGDTELADVEEKNIYSLHPEFKDRRISNLRSIKKQLFRPDDSNSDLVIIYTNTICPICSKYHRKLYSISGDDKRYPKLPYEVMHDGGFCPSCYLSLFFYYEGISRPLD